MTLESTNVYITDGPSGDLIFDAAKHATISNWKQPILLTLSGGFGAVALDFVNGPTWMGHRSRFLSFTGRSHESKLDIVVEEYDVTSRSGNAIVTPFK